MRTIENYQIRNTEIIYNLLEEFDEKFITDLNDMFAINLISDERFQNDMLSINDDEYGGKSN
jgi:asparagine synthetase B (glutamine-hydrolysing)